MTAASRLAAVKNAGFNQTLKHEAVGNGLFWLYMVFLLEFFLRFSARVPAIGMLRPTMLLTLLIAVALFTQKTKLKGYGGDPITKALIALFIYLIVSLPLVEWPGSVIKNNLPNFIKAISFFFFTSLIIDSERRLKIFLTLYVSCQVFRVLEPLYKHITTGYWGSATHLGGGEFAGRLAGSRYDVINPNELGFVIVTAIPYLHYMIFSRGFKWKLLYFALMPCLLYALILTMSRGAFLALLVIAWMIFQKSKNKVVFAVVGIVVALCSPLAMNDVQKDRFFGMFSGGTSKESTRTLDGRISLIFHEFELGFERPIAGHGLGTTIEAKAQRWGVQQASHNMYGELIIEIGLIGAFFFIRFMARVYQGLKYNQLLMRDPERADLPDFYKNLNTTLLCVFWMFCVYSLNYWGLSQYYWYLFGGLILSFARLVQGYGLVEEKGSRKRSEK